MGKWLPEMKLFVYRSVKFSHTFTCREFFTLGIKKHIECPSMRFNYVLNSFALKTYLKMVISACFRQSRLSAAIEVRNFERECIIPIQ